MDLKEALSALKKYLWYIVAGVIVITVLSAYYSFSNYTPLYRASSKLLINNFNQNSGTGQVDVNSINANILIMNSYRDIIMSEAILDKVAKANPDLRLTGKQLIRYVSISSAESSQVMTITAYHTDNDLAIKLCNAVAVTFQSTIPSIMKVNNVTVLTPADPNDPPVNVASSPILNVLLAFLLSSMISVGLVLLRNYFDDSVRNESDISKALGISVLSSVPYIRKNDLKSSKNQINRPSQPSQRVGEQSYVPANH